jgi:hypothetical protein
MAPYALRIIKRAAINRIKAGEDIDEVLAYYTKLSDEERAAMRAEIIEELGPLTEDTESNE